MIIYRCFPLTFLILIFNKNLDCILILTSKYDKIGSMCEYTFYIKVSDTLEMENNMIFKYCEIVNAKSKNPLESIIINENNKSKKDKEEPKLILDVNEEYPLKQLYEYVRTITNEEYITINKSNWLNCMIRFDIKVNGMTTYIIKGRNIIEDKNGNITITYYENGKPKRLTFNKKEYLRPTRKSLFKIDSQDTNNQNANQLILCKEGNYETDRQLLYMVLDCLFSSNYNFYIKKCERCGNYYLTDKRNKQFCNRKKVVCGKDTTCCNALTTLYESKEYKKITRLVKRYIDKYYKNIEKYQKEIDEIYEKKNIILDRCREKLDITNEDIKELENYLSTYH